MIKDDIITNKIDPSKLISKITDNIYLSDYWGAYEKNYLLEKGIKKILCVGNKLKNFYPDIFIYKNIDIKDIEDEDISQYFKECFDFLSNECCLVHCQFGISRSATIVIAFIMNKYRMTYQDALEYVKKERPVVQPNKGFEKQL